jgi:hypothetical protein
MASEEARRRLYEAVTAHKVHLEITRCFSRLELEVLDRRIEDTRQLLEWLEQAHELPPKVLTRLKHLWKPRSRAPSSLVLAEFLSRSVALHDVKAPAPAARLALDRERRHAKV